MCSDCFFTIFDVFLEENEDYYYHRWPYGWNNYRFTSCIPILSTKKIFLLRVCTSRGLEIVAVSVSASSVSPRPQLQICLWITTCSPMWRKWLSEMGFHSKDDITEVIIPFLWSWTQSLVKKTHLVAFVDIIIWN